MSDDKNTDYTKMFGDEGEVAPPEPETIEDLVALEDLVDEEPEFETVDEVVEEVEEAEAVAVEETAPLIFLPTVPDGRHLNIRSTPDGDIKAKVDNNTLLYCIEDGPEWAWVEYEAEDGGMVRGYAKKEFLVTANG